MDYSMLRILRVRLNELKREYDRMSLQVDAALANGKLEPAQEDLLKMDSYQMLVTADNIYLATRS